jgi:hypothetical protein
MKGYFRLKRGAKVLQVDEEVIINGEADPFHTENKELGLLKKKKDSIYFDSKQRYGSPRITANILP